LQDCERFNDIVGNSTCEYKMFLDKSSNVGYEELKEISNWNNLHSQLTRLLTDLW